MGMDVYYTVVLVPINPLHSCQEHIN